MLGATVIGVSTKRTVVSARRADAPTVLPRPQVIRRAGRDQKHGLAALLSFFWCGLGRSTWDSSAPA